MFRKILILLTGNVLSQVVNLITILAIVTYYFTPAEFGQYAVSMSYVGILSIVASLRYELAIVNVARRLTANNLFFAALLIAATFSIVAYVIVHVATQLFGDGFLMQVSAADIVLLVFLKAVGQVCASVYYRNELYKQYSLVKFLQALVLLAGFWIAGRNQSGNPGLILATGISYVSFAFFSAPVVVAQKLLQGVTVRRMLSVVKKNANFAKFSAPHSLFDNILANGLNLLLVAVAGPTIVGYFSYLHRLVKAPLGLLFAAISQVVFRFCAKNKANSSLIRAKLRQIMTLAATVLLAAAITVTFVWTVFDQLTFLDRWAGLQEYILPMTFWMLIPFVFSPFSTIPIVYDRQKSYFKIATSFNLVSLLMFAILSVVLTVKLAFWVIGALSVLYFWQLGRWTFSMTTNER